MYISHSHKIDEDDDIRIKILHIILHIIYHLFNWIHREFCVLNPIL
jgi:hypothetical protein